MVIFTGGHTVERKVGISTKYLQEKYGDKKALEIAAKIGADAVDFSLDIKNDYRNKDSIYSEDEEAVISYYKDLKEYADNVGLIISQTHGRHSGFKNIKEEDDALVENSRLDCLATATLGAPVCVIHNSTSIYMGADPDPKLMHTLSFDMYSRIIPFAKQYEIKIATETFGDAVAYNSCDFFGNIEEFEKAYNRIDEVAELRDYFAVCVDTGHSNKAMRYGNPTPAEVIRRLGSKVEVLHLNDNDTFIDQHKIPMTGVIDWNEVFNALDEINYNGVYNMELNLKHFGENFLVETAEFAIKVMKNFLANRYGCK